MIANVCKYIIIGYFILNVISNLLQVICILFDMKKGLQFCFAGNSEVKPIAYGLVSSIVNLFISLVLLLISFLSFR